MKKITNKLLWIFAVGQFGWSLLSGIVTNWMVYYYTGTPDAQNPNTGIFAAGITQEDAQKTALEAAKLKEEGKNKYELGREGFLKEAWKWKEEHGDYISKQ